MRVLASFLKARAPIPFKHEAVLDKWKYDEEIKPVEPVRPAVQAAVWALSELNRNRHPKSSEPRFQLKDVDLRHLPMQGLHLQNLDLSSALLVGADLSSCDLSNSKVYSTFIMSANFTGAILSGADFRFSRVDPSTTFSGATVQNTDFSGSRSGKEGDQNRITELTVDPDVIGKPAAFGEWKFRLDPKK